MQGNIPLRQSHCEKCLNFDHILKQASKYLCGIPEDLNKAIEISMCSYEGYFPNIHCVLHKCSDCSIDSLKQKLLDCNKSKLTDQQIGDVLIVNDFAQNYLCLHQNEPQGMHWEHKQVSLHPTVVYFRCKSCYNISTHEVVHVSNDLKHDAHIIKKFNEKTLQVLKNRGIEIRKMIFFSDQAPHSTKIKWHLITCVRVPIKQ